MGRLAGLPVLFGSLGWEGRISWVLVVLVGVLLGVGGSVGAQDQGVCSRTAPVRDALVAAAGVSGCGDVTAQHLGAVRGLNLSNQDPKITALAAGDFAGLTDMVTLQLQGNALTSLPSLSANTNLDFLDVSYNQLTSLPSLSANTALRALTARANKLTSLPDLSANTALQDLYVNDNQLTSLPDLSANTALRNLDVHNNELTELPDLSANIALQTLSAYHNKLTELPLLATNTALRLLIVNNNELTELPSLTANTALDTLTAHNNKLTELPSLTANTALRLLQVGRNQLKSLPDLSANVALNWITVENNQLTSLPSLSANTNLQYLYVHNNKLTSLPSLSANTALTSLYTNNNKLTSLPSLSANTALTSLYTNNNKLTSLPSLSANTALTSLYTLGNPLSSLPDLSGLTALRDLRVGYGGPGAVSGDFLGGLPSGLPLLLLEGVPLSSNDLAKIKAVTGLAYLYLGGTGLTSAEVDGLLDALPTGLSVLALDGNDLSGVSWSKLSRLASLTYLDVTGAKLDDTAASAITTNVAATLRTLRMGYNGLTVVPSLSRLTALATLYLDHNNLADTALGAGAFDGPTPAALTVRVQAGNAGVTLTEVELGTTFPDVTFEDPLVATSLLVTKQVRGGSGGMFGFALSCVKTGEDGDPRVNAFTVAAGETAYGPVHAPGLLVMSVNSGDFRVVDSATCTLTEPGSGRATPSGLFTDETITFAGKKATVTNTFRSSGSGLSAEFFTPPPPPPLPPPPFEDMAEAGTHQTAVEILARAEVFNDTECAPERFCPDQPVTRSTVAVWLLRTLGYQDPEAVDKPTRFEDVDPDQWWTRHVEQLAESGIIEGCDTEPARFCPDAAVTRAQLAALIARALQLPQAEPAGYTDTQGHWARAYIDAIHAAGITQGCATDPPRYCPNTPITRAQAATFLHRIYQPV